MTCYKHLLTGRRRDMKLDRKLASYSAWLDKPGAVCECALPQYNGIKIQLDLLKFKLLRINKLWNRNLTKL